MKSAGYAVICVTLFCLRIFQVRLFDQKPLLKLSTYSFSHWELKDYGSSKTTAMVKWIDEHYPLSFKYGQNILLYHMSLCRSWLLWFSSWYLSPANTVMRTLVCDLNRLSTRHLGLTKGQKRGKAKVTVLGMGG